jgi:hypothetical protein
MAIAEVDIWLSSRRDYSVGVALYVKYGKNEFLKKVFAQGVSDFNKQKLLGELTGLVGSEKLEDRRPETEDRRSKTGDGRREMGGGRPKTEDRIPNPQKGMTLRVDDEQYKTFTDDVRAIHTRAMDLNKINARRQKELYDLVREAKRIFGKDVAKINQWLIEHGSGDKVNIMLDTRKEMNELFYKVDYYKVHKKLPADVAKENATVLDKSEMKQRLLNLRSRISKLKKSIVDEVERDKAVEQLLADKALLEGRIDELI